MFPRHGSGSSRVLGGFDLSRRKKTCDKKRSLRAREEREPFVPRGAVGAKLTLASTLHDPSHSSNRGSATTKPERTQRGGRQRRRCRRKQARGTSEGRPEGRRTADQQTRPAATKAAVGKARSFRSFGPSKQLTELCALEVPRGDAGRSLLGPAFNSPLLLAGVQGRNVGGVNGKLHSQKHPGSKRAEHGAGGTIAPFV